MASDHLLSIYHTNKLAHTSEGELTSAWQGNLKMSLNIIQKGNQLCACFLLFRRWKNTWANQPSDSSWRDAMWRKGKNPASAVSLVFFTQDTILHCKKLQTSFMRDAEFSFLIYYYFLLNACVNFINSTQNWIELNQGSCCVLKLSCQLIQIHVMQNNVMAPACIYSCNHSVNWSFSTFYT